MSLDFVKRGFSSPHLWLLFGWIGLGSWLRFTNLTDKPPSTIEIATLGFSLGHGFLHMPVGQVIDLNTLLQPLWVDSALTAQDTIRELMQESTHPPLYFWLTHFWLQLWSPGGQVVSLAAGRSLSALFGVLAIPALFGLSWLAFRSRLVAQLAAALMAVSPYGVYLAQEARHYTLAVLWIIASLSCLVIAVHQLCQRSPLPLPIVCGWIGVNGLGMATHYFFLLVLIAEGLALVGVWFLARQRWLPATTQALAGANWSRVWLAVIGSTIATLVWLPALRGVSDSELTQWIQTDLEVAEWLEPIGRLLAWLVTMIVILPIEHQSWPVIVPMVLLILLTLYWLVPPMVRGIQAQWAIADYQPILLVLGGFVTLVLVLFLAIIYGHGSDVSVAPRYHFVYFPAFLLVIAAALALSWQPTPAFAIKPSGSNERFPRLPQLQGRQVIIWVLCMGLISSITVVSDLSFKKSRQTDVLAAEIESEPTGSILIAVDYETHAEIRSAIAIGYEMQQLPDERTTTPKFLILPEQDDPQILLSSLAQGINSLPKPLNLWTINLPKKLDLSGLNCQKADRQEQNTGYRDRHYLCQ
ncbi:glycosyltransferase family 39 protein [Pantanalinema rosaneae CENA516]|uniref:glycosyltransferase family 39 protein n=1 Tax=Pantanalinema rosaneae TaxID=1620701 RepID=UPI003D6F7D76